MWGNAKVLNRPGSFETKMNSAIEDNQIALPHEVVPISKFQSGAAPERGSYRRLRIAHPVEHVGSETPKADIWR